MSLPRGLFVNFDVLEKEAIETGIPAAALNDLVSYVGNTVISTLKSGRQAECITALRKLFVLCSSHSRDDRVPEKLIAVLKDVILHPSQFSIKVAYLSALILSVLSSNGTIVIDSKIEDSTVIHALPVLLNQPAKSFIDEILPQIIRWISTVGFDIKIQKQALSAAVTLATLDSDHFTQDQIHIVNSQLIEWLYGAGLSQAPNPFSKGFFSRDQNAPVQEIDGTPAKDFFTPLCVGQYYSADQMLNIHSVSSIRCWLEACHKPQTQFSEEIGELTESPGTSSYRDPDTQSLGGVSLDSRSSDFSGYGRSGKHSFYDRIVEFCIRVMEQSTLKPKVAHDASVQIAALVECIEILDSVCSIDSRLIGRVNSHIHRVISYTTLAQPRLLVALVKFCHHHGEKALYSAQSLYDLFFDKGILMYHSNAGVAYDTVTFLRDNLLSLGEKTDLLTRYFPNIFKILAWNPCSYIADFMDLLPMFITQTTFLEIFHILLDLPCISAALDVRCHAEKTDSPQYFSTESKNSLDAYNNTYFRPMFNFILRIESGHGDTIDRLNVLHELLQDKKQHQRVMASSQAVPVLLKFYFQVLLTDGSFDLVTQLVPVILERASLLYAIQEYQQEVSRIFSSALVDMFKMYPQLLMDSYNEIVEFLGNIRNVTDKEDIFLHLVWIIGEFTRTSYDSRCSTEVIGSLYETLEALSYEVSGLIQSDEKTCSVRLVSVLMSAVAKLASRSQDLLPRVILCLNKLSQQLGKSILSPQSKQIIRERASELSSLLKMPNVASFVLSPPPEIESGSWHTDNTSLPVLLHTTANLVHPT